MTLDVPKIVVLPTREVNYGFQDFDLQRLEKVNFQPISQEILLQHLDNNQNTSTHWMGRDTREEQLDNYLVRYLWDKDEIDYDEYAGLLYKLIGQLIAHLRAYLSNESQSDVLKWMKPASGQFRIEYQNGQNYKPDFVVECATHYLLIEPKRADQINTAEVQLKARAAGRWSGYANEHAKNNGNKLWFYLLVPHDAIALGRLLDNLKAEYS